MQEVSSTTRKVLLLLGCILFFANNHVISIALPLLISSSGIGLEIVGYCTAGMGAMTIIAKLFTTKTLGKFRLTTVLITIYTLLCIISAGLCLAKTATPIIMLRTLYGAPFSLFPIVNLMVVATTSKDDKELRKTTSFIGMAMPISITVSPLLVEALTQRVSYKTIFFVALTCSMLSATIYLFATNKGKTPSEERTKETKDPTSSKISSLTSPSTISFFFLGIVDILTLTYFPLIATYQEKNYSLFFAVFAISMVLSQSFYPKLRMADNRKLTIGYLLLGISAFFIAVCSTSFGIFSTLAAVLLGIGYSLTETTTNMIGIESNEGNSKTITYQQLSICLGRTIGPWFISLFATSQDMLSQCFLGIGISMLIPVVLCHFEKERSWRKPSMPEG